jgi:hypothetical protein
MCARPIQMYATPVLITNAGLRYPLRIQIAIRHAGRARKMGNSHTRKKKVERPAGIRDDILSFVNPDMSWT